MNRRDFISGGIAALGMGAMAAPIRSVLSPNGILDAPLQVPTASDYVQDGLAFMWDGIENIGFGESDPTSRQWLDLITGMPINLCSAASFSGDSLHILASDEHPLAGAYMKIPKATAKAYTMFGTDDYVFGHMTATTSSEYADPTKDFGCAAFASFRVNSPCESWGQNILQWTADGNGFGGAIRKAENGSLCAHSATSGSRTLVASSSVYAGLSMSIGICEKNEYLPETSSRKGEQSIWVGNSLLYRHVEVLPSTSYYWNRNLMLPFIYGSDGRCFTLNANDYRPSPVMPDIEFYNLRFYLRMLSPEEIAYNYSIDKMRFGI